MMHKWTEAMCGPKSHSAFLEAKHAIERRLGRPKDRYTFSFPQARLAVTEALAAARAVAGTHPDVDSVVASAWGSYLDGPDTEQPAYNGTGRACVVFVAAVRARRL